MPLVNGYGSGTSMPPPPPLPASLSQLPGVTASLGTGSTSGTGGAPPQEMVYEGSGSSAQSQYRTETRRLEFEADLKNNSQLEDMLVQAGLPTDPRGLADVSGKAARYPKEFTELVNAARDAALSLGKNPAANDRYKLALQNFIKVANVPKNELGDLMYIIMRVSTAEASKDNDALRKQLLQQIGANSKLIDALRQYQKEIEAAIANAHPGEGKNAPMVVDLAEADFRLSSAGNVERIADANPDATNVEVKQEGHGLFSGTSIALAAGGIHTSDSQREDHMNFFREESGRSPSGGRTMRVLTLDGAKAELAETKKQMVTIDKANAELRAIASQLQGNGKAPSLDPTLLLVHPDEAYPS